jgi:cellulose synthase/poly-beta-1,6-N-acetylglucosamine synthase-like glycosyltransferase
LISSRAVNTKDELEGAKFSVTPKVFEITYSIIIPSFNEGPRLLKLLTQLNSLSSSEVDSYHFAFEIIVVDDFSDDGTVILLKKFKDEKDNKNSLNKSKLKIKKFIELKNLSFGESRDDNISGLSTDAETEIEETLA